MHRQALDPRQTDCMVDLTALSSVCRQLHSETALMPFSLNVWSFAGSWDEEAAGRCLQVSTARQRAAVRWLEVDCWARLDVKFARLLRGYGGLQSVAMVCKHGLSCGHGEAYQEVAWDRVGGHVEVSIVRESSLVVWTRDCP